jgi:tetratricopeptide (TPR) repeat protein
MEAYGRACGLSSSEHGDDLPGLLCNWGAGLLAAAARAQDPGAAIALLEEAAQRLRESIAFDRGDVAPHNALGDALAALAEHAARRGDAAGAAAALRQALDAGYSAALRINSGNAEALVGTAEVQAQMAKLAGAGAGAGGHWAAAVAAYEAALARPEALGSLSQRSDARYNYACSLAGCGRVAEAASVVRALVAAGTVAAADALADADLAAVHAHLL